MHRRWPAFAREEGFTLAELLIVVTVAGILLAIAVPSYLGFTDKARTTGNKANARNAVINQAAGDAVASVDPPAAASTPATPPADSNSIGQGSRPVTPEPPPSDPKIVRGRPVGGTFRPSRVVRPQLPTTSRPRVPERPTVVTQ